MKRWLLSLTGLALAGCSTVMGTNLAQDRLLPPNAVVEKLGPVYGSASGGHWLWAVWADKKLYDEARRDALNEKKGDLLLDAKIATTLTSYLSLYYRTEITIMGTAGRVASPSPPLPASPPLR